MKENLLKKKINPEGTNCFHGYLHLFNLTLSPQLPPEGKRPDLVWVQAV